VALARTDCLQNGLGHKQREPPLPNDKQVPPLKQRCMSHTSRHLNRMNLPHDTCLQSQQVLRIGCLSSRKDIDRRTCYWSYGDKLNGFGIRYDRTSSLLPLSLSLSLAPSEVNRISENIKLAGYLYSPFICPRRTVVVQQTTKRSSDDQLYILCAV
jgi:hypothetical protein